MREILLNNTNKHLFINYCNKRTFNFAREKLRFFNVDFARFHAKSINKHN